MISSVVVVVVVNVVVVHAKLPDLNIYEWPGQPQSQNCTPFGFKGLDKGHANAIDRAFVLPCLITTYFNLRYCL